MAQQIINIGSAPNDGTGDALRISFDKSNSNFTELYDGVAAAAPLGPAIEYQFNNSTAEPPASGEIRFNQATQASTTKLWASHVTSSGVNIKQMLSAAVAGSKLILQDRNDNTNYIKFDVTADPVDKTTYWEFAVAVTAAAGNLPNARILAAVTAATATGGGGGNVSNSGTPANGQIAQWTDATHIQGVAASTLGFAPLASPTFTGDPKAPTPTAGDNDTSIATTAFVKAAIAAIHPIISLNVQKFTASGTYTPSAGMAYAIVECIGGGGGGSGVNSTTQAQGGGGGGSGGYSRRLITAATIGASQVVTIGAAGNGGIGAAAGTSGGITSVGSLCSANGGGAASISGGWPASIAGAVGDITSGGAPGEAGYLATTATGFASGAGGSSVYGGGGVGVTNFVASGLATGTDGSNYGSGGSGGWTNAGGSANGGNGTPGIVIITEYISG